MLINREIYIFLILWILQQYFRWTFESTYIEKISSYACRREIPYLWERCSKRISI